MKAILKSLAALSIAMLAGLDAQAQPVRYIPDTHYIVLESPESVPEGRQEVLEVFWYGCPSCYAFESLLQVWLADKAGQAVLARSPGLWDSAMEIHARLYYSLQALGLDETLHQEVFDAIHGKGETLLREKDRETFLSARGVDMAAFARAWNSFGVDSKVRKAQSRQRDWGIPSVPSLIVNGKYRVSANESVPSQAEMLKVVDYLLTLDES